MRPALAALILLAACAARTPEPVRDPAPPGAVTAPNFGDTRPHPWSGRSPQDYPVHGTDVSRFQTAVDWQAARANGINFVFVKATEGGDLADPMFTEHWHGARAAGVRAGAYHFWYHCRPGGEQARWFIRHVPRVPRALPPVLDLEWTPFSPTCTRRTPQEELLREAQAFLDIVARHYGQRPLVYASPDIFHDRELWRLRGADFWLRSVADHPARVYPGRPWVFWQYSGTGVIPGIPNDGDLNVFAGGPEEWAAWLASRAP